MAIQPTNREIHSQEIRKKILITAQELFREYGYEDVGMKDIAAAVGATTGMLYHHFRSKEDILAHIPQLHVKELAPVVETLLAKEDSVEAIAEFLVDIMGKRVLDEGVMYTKHRIANVLHMDHRGIVDSTVTALLNKAQEQGRLVPDYTLEEIADFLVSIFRGAVYYYAASNGQFDLQPMLRQRLAIGMTAVTIPKAQ